MNKFLRDKQFKKYLNINSNPITETKLKSNA